MIFVDTNVFMYAVGRPHPLRERARRFFAGHLSSDAELVTSAEVMQELLHAYLPVGRMAALDAALELVRGLVHDVVPVTGGDVFQARALADARPGLGARDLIHLAVCARIGASRLVTYDRALGVAQRELLGVG